MSAAWEMENHQDWFWRTMCAEARLELMAASFIGRFMERRRTHFANVTGDDQ